MAIRAERMRLRTLIKDTTLSVVRARVIALMRPEWTLIANNFIAYWIPLYVSTPCIILQDSGNTIASHKGGTSGIMPHVRQHP
jgi:hypothetical protein